LSALSMRFDDYKTHLKHFNTVLIHALKAIPLTSLINRLDMQGLFSVLVFITPTQGVKRDSFCQD